MLKWIIAGELILLVVMTGLAARRYFHHMPRAAATVGRPKRAIPFATRWTAEPLDRPASPRVRICKSAHVMTVFDGEVAVKSYRVAVGGGRGDKVREGDQCTPEGEFYICVKNPRSRYVRSLGLSYPDEADAARGLRDGLITRREHDAIVRAVRRKGCPPWDTALGGEIMIHGCRDERDWTLGCIAMDDPDIREVYPALPVGTPVTIVP